MAVAQVGEKLRAGVVTTVQGETYAVENGRDQMFRGVDRLQGDEVDAIGVIVRLPGGDRQGQARLADTSGAN